jgi:hypothetical protein
MFRKLKDEIKVLDDKIKELSYEIHLSRSCVEEKMRNLRARESFIFAIILKENLFKKFKISKNCEMKSRGDFMQFSNINGIEINVYEGGYVYGQNCDFHYDVSKDIFTKESFTIDSNTYSIIEFGKHIFRNYDNIHNYVTNLQMRIKTTDICDNYYSAVTFLLCNRRTKSFLKEIANIIANKILFFIFYLGAKRPN